MEKENLETDVQSPGTTEPGVGDITKPNPDVPATKVEEI